MTTDLNRDPKPHDRRPHPSCEHVSRRRSDAGRARPCRGRRRRCSPRSNGCAPHAPRCSTPGGSNDRVTTCARAAIAAALAPGMPRRAAATGSTTGPLPPVAVPTRQCRSNGAGRTPAGSPPRPPSSPSPASVWSSPSPAAVATTTTRPRSRPRPTPPARAEAGTEFDRTDRAAGRHRDALVSSGIARRRRRRWRCRARALRPRRRRARRRARSAGRTTEAAADPHRRRSP